MEAERRSTLQPVPAAHAGDHTRPEGYCRPVPTTPVDQLLNTHTHTQLHTHTHTHTQFALNAYKYIHLQFFTTGKTQLSKPLLKEQNNGSDLHHYKHMSTSHFLRNNTHKLFAKHLTHLNALDTGVYQEVTSLQFQNTVSNNHTYEPVKYTQPSSAQTHDCLIVRST